MSTDDTVAAPMNISGIYYQMTALNESKLFSDHQHFDSILKNFKDLFLKTPMTISLMVLYSLTFVIGLAGNVFVILVVIRFRSMRTLTNMFLFNLTVGDLMVVCVCMPMTLGRYIYQDWIYGSVMCKVYPFLQCSAVAVSALSLLSISINRYFAIHRPLHAKVLFSRPRVYVIIVSTWMLSFIFSAPLILVNKTTTFGYPGIFEATSCREHWENLPQKQAFNLVIFIVLFVSPLVVIGVAYTRVSLALWYENGVLYRMSCSALQDQSERVLQQRRRTIRMLIFLVVFFGCSWLPYYVVNIWLDFNISSRHTFSVVTYVYPLLQLLGLSNSCFNPICYCFLSQSFRKAFFNLCCCRRRRVRISFKLVTYRMTEVSHVDSIHTPF